MKNRKALEQFAFEMRKCACCWITESAARRHRFPQWLQTHHIIKFGRSDERCNFLRLCAFCHGGAEDSNQRFDGELLPKLTIATCLWLKIESDPEHAGQASFARLQVLYGKNLPAPAELHESWLRYRQASSILR